MNVNINHNIYALELRKFNRINACPRCSSEGRLESLREVVIYALMREEPRLKDSMTLSSHPSKWELPLLYIKINPF